MTERPNILFIFSDQQHWEAAGFEDASFQTPNLDRLAREGAVFTHAFCTTPQCSPSRSSILTGLYPSKTGMLGNVDSAGGTPLRLRTIGALLQDAGYRTAYFGKWHLGKDSAGTAGWDEEFGVTGPDQFDDPEVTRRAVRFLNAVKDTDRPFALFLSYNNPHDIYEFGREAAPAPQTPLPLPDTWHRKDLSTVPAVQQQYMAEDAGRKIVNAEPAAWQRYRELYREKVKLYDDALGPVLSAVDEHDLSDSTVVMATSDHGDMDAQHGLVYKGPFMYEHMVRVPLIVRVPGAGPKTLDFLTVNVDLVPTLADLTRTTVPRSDGVSLAPLLTGNGPLPRRDFVIGQYYSKQKWVNPIRMIRTARHKYNWYGTHGEELYDLMADPEETRNLASDVRYRQVKEELAATLRQWLKDNDDAFESQVPTTRDGQALA
jgi:arylsulfatase A-like enzyme